MKAITKEQAALADVDATIQKLYPRVWKLRMLEATHSVEQLKELRLQERVAAVKKLIPQHDHEFYDFQQMEERMRSEGEE